jgi:hypothetical protein
MTRILPLGGKYGGFDTWEDYRRDLEKQRIYDPVLVGLQARTEAIWAKRWSIVSTVLSTLGVVVSLYFGLRCGR